MEEEKIEIKKPGRRSRLSKEEWRTNPSKKLSRNYRFKNLLLALYFALSILEIWNASPGTEAWFIRPAHGGGGGGEDWSENTTKEAVKKNMFNNLLEWK